MIEAARTHAVMTTFLDPPRPASSEAGIQLVFLYDVPSDLSEPFPSLLG